ncbi:MAG: transposase-like protein, partial [Verrucomicrobiales bacterium]
MKRTKSTPLPRLPAVLNRPRRAILGLACIGLFLMVMLREPRGEEPPPVAQAKGELESMFDDEVKPLLAKFCLDCHSTEEQKGELDLERFTSLGEVRKDVKPWQAMIEQLETGEMPPKKKAQPTAPQRELLIAWTQRFLAEEALANAGDPGRVPLRRLSNAEYDRTIRDLTGVDLRPTQDFPADGAAGEGFTNAAEALSMSPAMMSKYVKAAKEIAAHAELLPDGFRFSNTKTRRDWTDENLLRMRQFYGQFTSDGSLPLQPYLSALVRHREDLRAGKVQLETIATDGKLSANYLSILWQALNGKQASFPLDRIRARWRTASEADVGAIVAEVSTWRDPLWDFGPIGSYRNDVRAVAKEPTITDIQPIRLEVKPPPGQSEVVIYLSAIPVGEATAESQVVWERPRFEGANLPTLSLRDYEEYGAQFEIDFSVMFAATEKYLAAAVEAANQREPSVKDVAAKHGLDAAWLERWIKELNPKPTRAVATEEANSDTQIGRTVPAVPLQALDDKNTNPERPSINGWQAKGADLPILISNSSDKVKNVPGRVSPHRVTVHPTPTEFVAAVWTSPFAGQVRVTAKVEHAHPNCGNGVAWWLEQQTPGRSAILEEGAVDLGKAAELVPQTLNVRPGDAI